MQRDHTLHITLRNAQKITPVAQSFRSGEGQALQIVHTGYIQIALPQMPGIKRPAQGLPQCAAQQGRLRCRQFSGQFPATVRPALTGQPAIKRAGAETCHGRLICGICHYASPYRRVPSLAVRLCRQNGIMRPSGRTTWMQQPRTRSRSRLKAS